MDEDSLDTLLTFGLAKRAPKAFEDMSAKRKAAMAKMEEEKQAALARLQEPLDDIARHLPNAIREYLQIQVHRTSGCVNFRVLSISSSHISN